MTSYTFLDAVERGVAKTITFHADEPLEDRELEARMLRYNATRVEITPDSEGAPRLASGAEYDAARAARKGGQR